MQGDRDENRTWEVEVLPTGQGERRGTPPLGSRVLGTVVLIGAIAAGLAVLALLVVFAATVALIAMPVALGAALIVWAGTKWRAHVARRGR
jgi:4-amino-4-deoxy-L-arabinose transferase-like glycosyltransferase